MTAAIAAASATVTPQRGNNSDRTVPAEISDSNFAGSSKGEPVVSAVPAVSVERAALVASVVPAVSVARADLVASVVPAVSAEQVDLAVPAVSVVRVAPVAAARAPVAAAPTDCPA